jgi:hypothetical protein
MDGEVVAAGSTAAGAYRGRRYFSIFMFSECRNADLPNL